MKITAVLLSIAAASIVFVVAQAGSAATSGPVQLHLLDVPRSSVPVGSSSQHQTPQPGDQVLLTDDVYTWNGAKRGAKVGRVEATLNFRTGFSFEKGGLVYVVGQVFLPDGGIMIEGFVHIGSGASPFVMPVVGGTGKYAGVRGALTSHDIGADHEKSAWTLSLLGAA
jgi:hypothetical protein